MLESTIHALFFSFVVRFCNKCKRGFALCNRFLGILCYNRNSTRRMLTLFFSHRKITVALCKPLSIDVDISVNQKASQTDGRGHSSVNRARRGVIFINRIIFHKWRQIGTRKREKINRYFSRSNAREVLPWIMSLFSSTTAEPRTF